MHNKIYHKNNSSLFKYLLLTFFIFAVSGLFQVYGDGTRTITDMLGREVTVPKVVNRVISGTPTTTIIVYMLAPEKLLGWNFKPNGTLITDRYGSLPVIGGWFGKKSGNYETLIAMKPEIYLEGYSNLGDVNRATLDKRQIRMGSIPVVGIEDSAGIDKYSRVISFIGGLIGVEKEAESLNSYYLSILKQVKSFTSSLKENERVKVYYAEGPKGLLTDPSGSVHAELINLCGGRNVAEVSSKKGYGRIEISMEQVILWDPSVIITTESSFFKNVYSDPKWQAVKAVRDRKVYLSPREPFGWFDRPAGINRIPGILWTANKLYPDNFKLDELIVKIKEFYRQFYHYELKDSDIKRIFK